MPLLITFVCDQAHPHADGGIDGIKCDHSQSAHFDRDSETCGDLFRAFRSAGWHIAVPDGAGKPELVLCPAHRAALSGDDDTTEETKDP